MQKMTDVAVIGAGPYGLSLAANLRGRGIEHRIVGTPMNTWLSHMPKGMQLKSDGFASNLDDPKGELSLGKYCAARGIPYADIGQPVKLDTFTAYGLEFQRRFAPGLENKALVSLTRDPAGFLLRLNDGETFTAKRVVLALGISQFERVPEELSHLPATHFTHASKHNDPADFKDRDVTVIGGGSSAIDLSGLLHEAGAKVRMVARKPKIEIHGGMKLPRPIWAKLRHPMSPVGPSWSGMFYSYAPLVFHLLPEATRLDVVRTALGPAAGWFMQGRVVGKVDLRLGQKVRLAEMAGDRVRLILEDAQGARQEVLTEHVIAATGYKVNLNRYQFLGDDVRAQLKTVEATPVLNRHFELSVPGLYFIGPSAANSFGPLMRFAAGAPFAARRTAAQLDRTREVVAQPVAAPAMGAAVRSGSV